VCFGFASDNAFYAECEAFATFARRTWLFLVARPPRVAGKP